jgi:hypothetical protein
LVLDDEQESNIHLGSFLLSPHDSIIVKLASGKINSRRNPEKKKITHISAPEKLLKPKGYLKQTYVLAGKVFQPKVSQVKVKIFVEETSVVDLKETPQTKSSSTKASTSAS